MRLLGPLTLALALAAASAASAQSSPSETAAHVHRQGGYPSEIVVIDDDIDQEARGSASAGMGDGPHGHIGIHGDRDGGEAHPSDDFPLPDFVQDILNAIGRLLGAAAVPIGYVLFALGIALVIALVVYLIVTLRFPRADLEAQRRRDGGSAPEPTLDPLLAGSDVSPEEHAANGRYREAIHALFLRALRDATRAGDVDRRGRTAREVVGLVERAHGPLPPLVALLSLTELVWFGGRPATEAQYVEARGLAADVESRARSMGPALPVGAPA